MPRRRPARGAGRVPAARGLVRPALIGAVLGALIAVPVFAPASWLARAVSDATDGHLLLADARGSVWHGSALPVLTGGAGSRDAAALADRLHWRVGLTWQNGPALVVHPSQPCCVNEGVALRVRPGIQGGSATLVAPPGGAGQWPSAWLAGLGTPWNTLQLGGSMRLVSPGLTLGWTAGRLRVAGSATLELLDVSSTLSTLPSLGSYRFEVTGTAAGDAPPQLTLSTLRGALRLDGSGTWGPGGMRFRGDARAETGDAAALDNLLNIIGRRDGARSVISIG